MWIGSAHIARVALLTLAFVGCSSSSSPPVSGVAPATPNGSIAEGREGEEPNTTDPAAKNGEGDAATTPACPKYEFSDDDPKVSLGFMRVRRSGRIAFSIARLIDGPPARSQFEIWDDDPCGGDRTLLVKDVGHLAFAFDEADRLVYFSRGAPYRTLTVLRGTTSAPFATNCTYGNFQKMFVDISKSGQVSLVSGDDGGGGEFLAYATGRDGCGTIYREDGTHPAPFGPDAQAFAGPTRLSPNGKKTLRMLLPSPDCRITTPPAPPEERNPLLVYDHESGVTVRIPYASIQQCSPPAAVAWVDDRYFLAATGENLYRLDATGQVAPQLVRTLPFWASNAAWLDVSPDGKWVAVGALAFALP